MNSDADHDFRLDLRSLRIAVSDNVQLQRQTPQGALFQMSIVLDQVVRIYGSSRSLVTHASASLRLFSAISPVTCKDSGCSWVMAYTNARIPC